MTLREACERGMHILLEAGVLDAGLDAWLLLEHVSQVSRAMYYALPDKAMTAREEEIYFDYIEKRAQHIPLQHLTGVQEFMGLEFQVNEHVLIPRQDTEILVESALKVIETKEKTAVASKQGEGTYRLLDMCTGSGCILLSILHYAGKYPGINLKGTGADTSGKALEVAKRNAQCLHIQAGFLCSDLFEQITGRYEMIVSNPPYIRTDVIDTLQEEVKNHDPMLALDGKEDGLYFYRKIIDEAGRYLTEDGYLIFEIGADQGEAVRSMMCQAGYRDVIVKKDLAGLDRVVIGVYDIFTKTELPCEKG
ncbi:MAG: peptide chain release factor N(5)-glutamine methyltransferase [Muricomes sp.]